VDMFTFHVECKAVPIVFYQDWEEYLCAILLVQYRLSTGVHNKCGLIYSHSQPLVTNYSQISIGQGMRRI